MYAQHSQHSQSQLPFPIAYEWCIKERSEIAVNGLCFRPVMRNERIFYAVCAPEISVCSSTKLHRGKGGEGIFFSSVCGMSEGSLSAQKTVADSTVEYRLNV